MTRRVRNALGRFLASVCVAALALLVVASSLAAQQTTGKLEGSVTDPQGAPVGNAQVTIVGTSFGALADTKGYYFINNVPVGTYTLRARFIGFTAAEVPGVRVLGGQTITQNIKLTPSAIAIGPVTVEAAANPIVPRDQVTSKAIIGGDLVNKLPIDDVRQVISLTPGVVESDANLGVSIRGGRPGEANVYIDGTPVRATNTGGQRITVGTNAVEEASVTTGALGVEFADAQAGVVAFTTRAGGQKYQGSASYATDEPFGDAISVGFNRFEGSFGGPVPSVQNLSFFGSAVLQGQSSAFLAKGADQEPGFTLGGVDTIVTSIDASTGAVSQIALPRYVQYRGECGAFGSSANAVTKAIQSNYGFDCQGRRNPLNWSTTLQLQGKLQYTYGQGSSIALTGVATGDQSRDWSVPTTATPTGATLATPPSLRSIGAPSLYFGTHNWERLGILNWSHTVMRTAERALAINLNLSWAQDRTLQGPLAAESDVESRDPTMGIQFRSLKFTGLDLMPFPITDDIVRNMRTNSGLRVPYLNRGDLENAQPFRMNPYALQSNAWNTTGLRTNGTSYSETRYSGRLMVDWQANRFHRFTLGADVTKSDIAYWSATLIDVQFMDGYVVNPIKWGAFAADRLDLGDVVVEVGARYDYYDARTLFPVVPGRIFSYYTDFNSKYPDAGTNDASYAAFLADKNVFQPSVGHHAISPRLRVSFPITERTDFRLSYAHQVQSPGSFDELRGINTDYSVTNTNQRYGRDLNYGKSILFEFGVRHAFSPDVVLDVAAYNKDKVSDIAARVIPYNDPRNAGTVIGFDVLTNRDFGNSRGLDFKFDWRVGNYVNATAAYTFQVAKNTGSNPYSYLTTFARQSSALSGDRTPPPEGAQPTDDNRTHNLTAAVALALPDDWRKGTALGQVLRNVNVFATFRAQSGLPYTRLFNAGDGQTAPDLNFGLTALSIEPLNSSTLPWTKNVDLRINKGLRFGRTDWTLYADIRNLFNFTNIVGLFAETGDVTNQKRKGLLLDSEFTGMKNEASVAGALLADGSINLNLSCAGWGKPINCVALRRAEARFGDGNGIYTVAEEERALNTYYDSFFGPWTFNGDPRHIRVGLEVNF